MNGEQRLWLEVLRVAFTDLQRDDGKEKGASDAFFFSNSAPRRRHCAFVCDMAGVDQDAMREHAHRLVTERRRRERTIPAWIRMK